MKKVYKFLIGTFVFIFGLLFGGMISFCSAETIEDLVYSDFILSSGTVSHSGTANQYFTMIDIGEDYGTYCIYFSLNWVSSSQIYFGISSNYNGSYSNAFSIYGNQTPGYVCIYSNKRYINLRGSNTSVVGGIEPIVSYKVFKLNSLLSYTIPSGNSSINVLYDNDSKSESIICNGDNVIQITGPGQYVNNNTFSPSYNIYYNSGLLLNSTTNKVSYLSGMYLYTLSGFDNVFSPVIDCSKPESQFSGYLPVFDVTGSTATIDTGNMFNNFSDNAFKVLLSNIPSYIQYVTIFAILFFLFGFLRRFKRKR